HWLDEAIMPDVANDSDDRHPVRAHRIAGPDHALPDRVRDVRPELLRELLVDHHRMRPVWSAFGIGEEAPAYEADAHGLEVARRRIPAEHHRVRAVLRGRRCALRTQEHAPVASERQAGDDTGALNARRCNEAIDKGRIQPTLPG